MDLAPKSDVETSSANELRQGVWSVISFDRHEAGRLTYNEAIEKIEELDKDHVPGLCIVTDHAAEKAYEA